MEMRKKFMRVKKIILRTGTPETATLEWTYQDWDKSDVKQLLKQIPQKVTGWIFQKI